MTPGATAATNDFFRRYTNQPIEHFPTDPASHTHLARQLEYLASKHQAYVDAYMLFALRGHFSRVEGDEGVDHSNILQSPPPGVDPDDYYAPLLLILQPIVDRQGRPGFYEMVDAYGDRFAELQQIERSQRPPLARRIADAEAFMDRVEREWTTRPVDRFERIESPIVGREITEDRRTAALERPDTEGVRTAQSYVTALNAADSDDAILDALSGLGGETLREVMRIDGGEEQFRGRLTDAIGSRNKERIALSMIENDGSMPPYMRMHLAVQGPVEDTTSLEAMMRSMSSADLDAAMESLLAMRDSDGDPIYASTHDFFDKLDDTFLGIGDRDAARRIEFFFRVPRRPDGRIDPSWLVALELHQLDDDDGATLMAIASQASPQDMARAASVFPLLDDLGRDGRDVDLSRHPAIPRAVSGSVMATEMGEHLLDRFNGFLGAGNDDLRPWLTAVTAGLGLPERFSQDELAAARRRNANAVASTIELAAAAPQRDGLDTALNGALARVTREYSEGEERPMDPLAMPSEVYAELDLDPVAAQVAIQRVLGDNALAEAARIALDGGQGWQGAATAAGRALHLLTTGTRAIEADARSLNYALEAPPMSAQHRREYLGQRAEVFANLVEESDPDLLDPTNRLGTLQALVAARAGDRPTLRLPGGAEIELERSRTQILAEHGMLVPAQQILYGLAEGDDALLMRGLQTHGVSSFVTPAVMLEILRQQGVPTAELEAQQPYYAVKALLDANGVDNPEVRLAALIGAFDASDTQDAYLEFDDWLARHPNASEQQLAAALGQPEDFAQGLFPDLDPDVAGVQYMTELIGRRLLDDSESVEEAMLRDTLSPAQFITEMQALRNSYGRSGVHTLLNDALGEGQTLIEQGFLDLAAGYQRSDTLLRQIEELRAQYNAAKTEQSARELDLAVAVHGAYVQELRQSELQLQAQLQAQAEIYDGQTATFKFAVRVAAMTAGAAFGLGTFANGALVGTADGLTEYALGGDAPLRSALVGMAAGAATSMVAANYPGYDASGAFDPMAAAEHVVEVANLVGLSGMTQAAVAAAVTPESYGRFVDRMAGVVEGSSRGFAVGWISGAAVATLEVALREATAEWRVREEEEEFEFPDDPEDPPPDGPPGRDPELPDNPEIPGDNPGPGRGELPDNPEIPGDNPGPGGELPDNPSIPGERPGLPDLPELPDNPIDPIDPPVGGGVSGGDQPVVPGDLGSGGELGGGNTIVPGREPSPPVGRPTVPDPQTVESGLGSDVLGPPSGVRDIAPPHQVADPIGRPIAPVRQVDSGLSLPGVGRGDIDPNTGLAAATDGLPGVTGPTGADLAAGTGVDIAAGTGAVTTGATGATGVTAAEAADIINPIIEELTPLFPGLPGTTITYPVYTLYLHDPLASFPFAEITAVGGVEAVRQTREALAANRREGESLFDTYARGYGFPSMSAMVAETRGEAARRRAVDLAAGRIQPELPGEPIDRPRAGDGQRVDDGRTVDAGDPAVRPGDGAGIQRPVREEPARPPERTPEQIAADNLAEVMAGVDASHPALRGIETEGDWFGENFFPALELLNGLERGSLRGRAEAGELTQDEITGYLAVVNEVDAGNLRETLVYHEGNMSRFAPFSERGRNGRVDDTDFEHTELARQMIRIPGRETTVLDVVKDEGIEVNGEPYRVSDFMRAALRVRADGTPQEIAAAFNAALHRSPTLSDDGLRFDGEGRYLEAIPTDPASITPESLAAAARWQADFDRHMQATERVAELARPIREWMEGDRADYAHLLRVLGTLREASSDPIAQNTYRRGLGDVRAHLGAGSEGERVERLLELFRDASTRNPDVLRDLLLTDGADGAQDFHGELGLNANALREVAERLVDAQQAIGDPTLVALPPEVTTTLARRMRVSVAAAAGLDDDGYNTGGSRQIDANVRANVREAAQLHQQFAAAIGSGDTAAVAARLRGELDADLESRLTQGTPFHAAESLARMYAIAGDERRTEIVTLAARSLRDIADDDDAYQQVGLTLSQLSQRGEDGAALARRLIEILCLPRDERSPPNRGINLGPVDEWDDVMWYIMPDTGANPTLGGPRFDDPNRAASITSAQRAAEQGLLALGDDFLGRMRARINDQGHFLGIGWDSWDSEDKRTRNYLDALIAGERPYTGN